MMALAKADTKGNRKENVWKRSGEKVWMAEFKYSWGRQMQQYETELDGHKWSVAYTQRIASSTAGGRQICTSMRLNWMDTSGLWLTLNADSVQ